MRAFSDNRESITFFYPSKILGGAELLFVRLAEKISEQFEIKVFYIEYADGIARKFLTETDNLKFISFNKTKKLQISPSTCLVTPLSSIIDLVSFINIESEAKVLFWSIHPLGLKNTLSFLQKSFLNRFLHVSPKLINEEIERIYNTGSIVFMDGPNYSIQKDIFEFNFINPEYLPIPLPQEDLSSSKLERLEGRLSLGWLGRLSEEKIHPVLNIIDHAHLFAEKNQKKLDLHVIGEGEFAHLLSSYPRREFVNIVQLGSISGVDLERYLTLNVDILFAMGTSALEGARLSIPTVLVDFAYKKVPSNNSFRWLYESSNFSLGDEFNEQKVYGHSFSSIINAVSKEGGKEIQGKRCLDYFLENHEMSSVMVKFFRAIDLAKCELRSLRNGAFSRYQAIGIIRRVKNLIK